MTGLEQIREKRPIVHCITNIVTVNDCANILLAIGASPIMAHHPLEVAEITSNADALVINMGALDDFEAMYEAAKSAIEHLKPIVIDPVGVAGSTFRRNQCLSLMKEFKPTCIRGNYKEICSLIDNQNKMAGLDAPETTQEINENSDLVRKIKEYAAKEQMIIVASGKTDIITDGDKTVFVNAGHEMMRSITGSGCMASSVLGAFLSVEKSVYSVADACEFIGMIGEKAASETLLCGGGTMTFRTKFIDAASILL